MLINAFLFTPSEDVDKGLMSGTWKTISFTAAHAVFAICTCNIAETGRFSYTVSYSKYWTVNIALAFSDRSFN